MNRNLYPPSSEYNLQRIYQLVGGNGRGEGGRFPQDMLNAQLLDENGNVDMNVDGSVTPVPFFWENTTGVTAYVEAGTLVALTKKENVEGFLPFDPLPNGMLFQVLDQDGDVIQDFGTNALPIQRHAEMAQLTDRITADVSGSGVNTRWALTFNFAVAYGAAIRLEEHWRIQWVVQDNLANGSPADGISMLRTEVLGYIAQPHS